MENQVEKKKVDKWQVLFWIAFFLLMVLGGKTLLSRCTASVVQTVAAAEEEVVVAEEEAVPDALFVAEAPKPLNHYAIKGSVAAGGYTEYVPSSQYRMEVDEKGVTFLSNSGRKLLRCEVMEHLSARWPDPNDPALLRYRTVYEDWGYRAVFEYVEEWPGEDGKTTFKLGPVAFFRIPQD
jgi:hypothetical protein